MKKGHRRSCLTGGRQAPRKHLQAMPRTRGIYLASVFLFYSLAALVRTLLVDAIPIQLYCACKLRSR
jgi:hypothetical protein